MCMYMCFCACVFMCMRVTKLCVCVRACKRTCVCGRACAQSDRNRRVFSDWFACSVSRPEEEPCSRTTC